VAQDHDFELPLTAAAREHANDATQEAIQQTHQHDAQSEPITSTAARRNRISLPHKALGFERTRDDDWRTMGEGVAIVVDRRTLNAPSHWRARSSPGDRLRRRGQFNLWKEAG